MILAALRRLDASDRHGQLKRWSVLCGGEPKLLEHVWPECHFPKPLTTLRRRVFFTASVWQRLRNFRVNDVVYGRTSLRSTRASVWTSANR